MIRWLPAALLFVLISGCGGGGSGDPGSTTGTSQTPPVVSDAAISGMVSKGPLDSADLEFLPIDATGAVTGSALLTAITAADGSFNASIPLGSGPLLVRSSGGSYVDEADREPDPALKRRVTLGAGEGLESVIPPGATSSTISIATQALVYKTRRETQGDLFLQRFAANRDLALAAFGFDIVATVPANPVSPSPSLSQAQRQYAMVLGGLSNVVRRVSIDLGLPEPNIDAILAVARDFSDGRIDGLEDGVPVEVNGVAINVYSLNDEITRFRNNNFDSYTNTPLLAVDESVLSQPSIPVNTTPDARNDNYALDIGETLTITAPGVLLNDTDADGDPLSAVLVTGPVNASAFNLSADGSFSYTHNGSSAAPDSFLYLASDGVNDSSVATVTLIISNAAPVANDDSGTVLEGGTLNAASVLDNDTDANGDALNAVLVSGPANAAVFMLNNNGTYRYTHDGSETTQAQFSYRAFDGIDNSNTAVVTISITPVNDAPVAQPDNLVVDQGATQLLLSNGAASVLNNDTDAEGDALIAILVNPPVNGQLTLNPDGTLIYVHNGSDAPTDQFTYMASDGTDVSQAVAVNIGINLAGNSAPVANDDSATVDQGSTQTVLDSGFDSVLDNDTDADQDQLTAIIIDFPVNGQVILFTDGRFEYTHDGSQTSNDEFTYQAFDGSADSNVASVFITVNPSGNSAPVGMDDSLTVDEGGIQSVLDSGFDSVLDNDSDDDGDDLSAVLVESPLNGQLTLNFDGTFLYQHDGSETTSDAFLYLADDGQQESDLTLVTIQINPVNDNQPVGVDDSFSVNVGGTQTILTSGESSVLANDTDLDGDVLSALLHTAPQNGQLTLNSDGTFSYLHDGSPTSSDFFRYIPTDADVEVSTVIDSVTGVDAAFFTTGQPVVIRYDLDASVADTNPDAFAAVYPGATQRLLLDFPSLGATLDFTDGNVQVFDTIQGDQVFIFANQGTGTIDGADVISIEVDLIGPTTMLPDDGIPNFLPDIFTQLFAVINTTNGTTFVNFSVQDVSLTVPNSMSSAPVLVDILIGTVNTPPRLTVEPATQFQITRVLEGVNRAEHASEADTLFLLNANGSLTGDFGEVPTTTAGVEFAPGIFGPGAALGSGDLLFYEAQNNITSDTGTVEFWFQPNWNGNDSQDHHVLAWGDVGGILMGKDAANNWRIIVNKLVFSGTDTERSAGASVASWVAGEWHHCAFTWNATELQVFIDGFPVASAPVGYALPAIAATDFQLGASSNLSFLDGVVDELRISNTARSAVDIATSFAGGRLPLAIVSGTIVTDGAIGMPGVLDWNLQLTRIAEGGSVSLLGPLSGNNSVFQNQQDNLISSDFLLEYSLDGQIGEFGFCQNACGSGGPEWIIGGAGIGGHTERVANIGGGSTETLRDAGQTLFVGFGESDSGIDSVSVDFGVIGTELNLFPVFEDDEDADSALQFSVTDNTNDSLVSTGINNGTLALSFSDQPGPARLTVRATDTAGAFVETAFHVCVREADPRLINSYDFSNDLSDTLGNGNVLTTTGGFVDSGRYVFDANEGLRLTSALPCPTDYAIEVKLQVNDDLIEFNKIIDFQDLLSDDGLYTLQDGINFYPHPATSNSIVLNTDFTVGIERFDDQVEVFLNGAPVFSFNDGRERAAPIDNILNFFVDDLDTAQTESFNGSADFIRIHNDSSTFGTQPNGNNPPTDILLDNTTVDEGQAIGTVVGTFTTIDPDCCDVHVYTLVPGAGSDNNDQFQLVNNGGVFRLVTNNIFDASLTPTLSIRVQTDDQDNQGNGTFQQAFTITVNNISTNSPPTSLDLDGNLIFEQDPQGETVGTFFTADPDANDTHIYSLVAGPGDFDNGSFTIVGDELITADSFNADQAPQLSVRVRTDDQNGGTLEQSFDLFVISSNARLGAIELTDVVLDQPFDSFEFFYTATVPFTVDSTEATVFPENDNVQQITVNGQPIFPGDPSDPIALDEGLNFIDFEVLAEDGFTEEFYSIEITRLDAATFAQSAYIKASNPDIDDNFAYRTVISADGNTLIVSTIAEASAAAGVNGDQSDNSFPSSGAVYAFIRDASGIWSQQAYIKPLNNNTLATVFSDFGYRLAISADGNTLAVSARNESSGTTGINGEDTNGDAEMAGAAYVFVRNGVDWSQQAYIKASNTESVDFYGRSIAISGDGNTLAVGATHEDSIATGINGDQLDNSALDSGAAYVYTRSGVVWSQQAYIKASNAEAGDQLGHAVALSATGNTLAVTAQREASAAIGVNGDQFDNTAPGAGALYVFTRDVTTWSQQAYLKSSNPEAGDQLGYFASIDMSDDGDTLAVGARNEGSAATGIDGDSSDNSAPDSGAVYVYSRDIGGAWSPPIYIKASNTEAGDRFGERVSLSPDGSRLAVGAHQEDSAATAVQATRGSPLQGDNSAPAAGAAYLYSRDGGTWSQQAYVKAPNTEEFDQFGWSIELSSDELFVGALREDGSVAGINGDLASNNGFDSGAVYVYSLNAMPVVGNDPPQALTLTNQSILQAQNIGTAVGALVTADPDSTDTHVYTLVAGTGSDDNAFFQIAGDQLQTAAVLDASQTPLLRVRVRSEDGNGGSIEQAFQIRVFALNNAPTDIQLDNIILPEFSDFGQSRLFANIDVIDPDINDVHLINLISGVGDENNDQFFVDLAAGELGIIADQDALLTPTLNVRLRADDTFGGIFEKAFTIELISTRLSALALGDVVLDSAFDPNVFDYTATVPFTVDTTVVTPTPVSGGAIIMVNGVDVGSGGSSDPIALAQGSNTITVTVENGNAIPNTYTITVTRLMSAAIVAQSAYIKASTVDFDDNFGREIAVSADGLTMAVGTISEASAATGINGDELDNSAVQAGAVHVFTRSASGDWIQQAYLKASNTDPSDWFGYRVSLSDDGNTLAVAARLESSAATGINGDQADNNAGFSGAAYVFVRSGNTWSQQAYIKQSNTDANDAFARSIAISGDGNTLSVGASNEDSAATGVNGNQLDNTVSNSGAAYVYTRSGVVWTQQAYLKASNPQNEDQFGMSVGLSSDGNTLAVAASREDSSATGIDGDQNDNSAFDSGAVYVFTRDGINWSQQAYLKASNTGTDDGLGDFNGLTMSNDGNTLAVGAQYEDSSATGVDGDGSNNNAAGSGAAYVYARDGGGVWTQQAYLKASNTDAGDAFGLKLSLSPDGTRLLIGATGESSVAQGIDGNQADNNAPTSGAAYLFVRDGANVWSQTHYIKSSNVDSDDIFGSGIALADDVLAIGATFEDGSSAGINGDQSLNNGFGSGAVYVYGLNDLPLPGNDPPLALTLSNQSVLQNTAAATLVGNLITADPDASDVHSYSLVPGVGDVNNGFFQIAGDQLQTDTVLDALQTPLLSVRVRSDDGNGGSIEQAFQIRVFAQNTPPTDIQLDNLMVSEFGEQSVAFANISVVDPDLNDNHIITVTPGVGDENNDQFSVNQAAGQLQIDPGQDALITPTLNVRLRANDTFGGIFEKAFTIEVISTRLSALALTDVVLDQPFNANTFNYTATVPSAIDTTVVTPTPVSGSAFILVNGNDLNGGISDPIALVEGSNTISVTVENGNASPKTYTITIIRESAINIAYDYIKASNTGANDLFGVSAAMSADANTLIVGALQEMSSATGVNGNQADNSANAAGAAYVLTRDGQGSWTQQAYLKASNAEASDFFGEVVAISADGNVAAVAAPDESSNATGIDGDQLNNLAADSGAVYLFGRDGQGIWSQLAYLKASDTQAAANFGQSLSLAADGRTLAVGSPGESSLGTGVDPPQDPNVGGTAGAVYVFAVDGFGNWSQQAFVKATNTDTDDLFGDSVALSADGSTLAVGARQEDSGAAGVNGDQTNNGGIDAGAAYVYVRDAGVWQPQAYIKASNPNLNDGFGDAIALSADGNRLAVSAESEASAATGIGGNQADDSAPTSGAVYIYDRDGQGLWSQQAYVKASNTETADRFGRQLSFDAHGEGLLVAASFEDSAAVGIDGDQADNSAPNSGAAYLFEIDNGIWLQNLYIKASNTEGGDFLGTVAFAGNGESGVLGASNEDSVAIGSNGDQTDNSANNAGAVYVLTGSESGSSIADLSTLTASGLTLDQPFDAATLSYTATVPFSVASTMITAFTADPNGVFFVNGLPYSDGIAGPAISLDVGTTTLSILITAEDGTTQTYTIVITRQAGNSAPTAMAIDNAQIDEGGFTNMVIGTFTTTDPDALDEHTYALVAGAGDDNNNDFNIDNDELQNSVVFDVPQTETRSIRVQTSDGNGGTFEQVFGITINNISNPRTWINPVDGEWTDPANWSPTGVPQPGDDVLIDVGIDNPIITLTGVQADINSINSFESLLIDANSRIIVHGPSTLRSNTLFEEGALLEADGPDAELTIEGQLDISGVDLQVFGGGLFTVNINSFVSERDQVWLAADIDSTMVFPNLQTVQLGTPAQDSGALLIVEAFDGGIMDLPALTSVLIDDGTSVFQNSAKIEVECGTLGASIQMPQLSSLIDNDDDGGGGGGNDFRLSRFEAFEDCTIDIPLLTAPEQSNFIFGADGIVDSEQLTALVGGRLDIGAGNFNYPNLSDLTGSTLILRENATATLNAVTDFDHAGAEVYGGSVLSLPGVTSYLLNNRQTPDGALISTLFRSSGAGSRLEFPNLVTMQAGLPTDDTGPRIDVQAFLGGLVDFPLMTTASVDDGNSVFERRSDIDMMANGAGSRIQLPQLISFLDNDYSGNEDGMSALISGVDSIIQVPSLTQTNRVAFIIDETASIDIGQLQTVTNGVLEVDNGTYNFDSLTDLTGSIVRGGSASQGPTVITLPNVTTLDHGSIEAYNGTTVALPGILSYFHDNPAAALSSGLQNEALWFAGGTNSRIELPNLASIEVGQAGVNTGPRLFIDTATGGVIDLSAASTIAVRDDTAAFNHAEIGFLADGTGSLVDLSQLQSFDDMDLGIPSMIEEANNGVISFPASAVLSNVIVNGNQFPTSLSLDNQSVQEGQSAGTLVGAFSTIDPDAGDTHTYTLVTGTGSTNNSLFQISGDQLLTAAPISNGEDPMPSIRVRTEDQSGGKFEAIFIITVSAANSAPTAVFIDNTEVFEDDPIGTPVGMLTTADADAGDSHVYSLVAGAGDMDNNLFQVVGDELQTAAPLDSLPSITVTVRVQTDDQNGGLFADSFLITVNPSNADPTAIQLSNDRVSEGLPSGTTVGTLTTTDADSFDFHTYTLVAGVGADDNALFQIVDDQLLTAAVFDATVTPQLTILVQTDDGNGGTFQQSFLIDIIDVRTITWVSQSSGLWSTPGNWSPAGPPLSDDRVVINVPGVVVTLDVDSSINSITSDQSIEMLDQSSFLVEAPSTIDGLIIGNNTYIGAGGPAATFTLSNVTVLEDTIFEAFLEATLSILDSSLNTNARNHNWLVSDKGTIEFPNLISIQAGLPGVNEGSDFVIDAFGGGVVDFPSLQSITLPDGGGGLFRSIIISAIDPGTQINMPQLTIFDDLDDSYSGINTGNSKLQVVAGGNILVPQLTETESVEFSIDGSSFINISQLTAVRNGRLTLDGRFFALPNLTDLSGSIVEAGVSEFASVNLSAVTNFNHAGATVSNGTVLTLPAVTSYSHSDNIFFGDVFWVADVDSELNFPNLTSIVISGDNSGPRWTSQVFGGGIIDLPLLESVTVLDDGGFRDSYASFEARDAGSRIQMPELITFIDNDPDAETGGLSFIFPRQGGFIAMPLLTSTHGVGMHFDANLGLDFMQLTAITDGLLRLDSGSTAFPNLTDVSGSILNFGATGLATVDLTSVTSMNNAGIEVRNGTSLTFPGVLSYQLSQNNFLDVALWLADGTGSRLEFENLATGQVMSLNNTENWTIEALNGGVIDLPALTSLTVSDGGGFRAADIDVHAASGGSVLMPVLTTFNDADPDVLSGLSSLQADDGTILIPSLTSLDQVALSLGTTSTMDIAQFVSITNGEIVLDGQTYLFPNLTNISGSIVRVGASFLPTTVDFSSVMTANSCVFEVYSDNQLSLPSVTGMLLDTNLFNDSGDWIVQEIGSQLNFPALTSLQVGTPGTNGARRWTMFASEGGVIDFPVLANISVTDGGNFSVRDLDIFASGFNSEVQMPLLTSFFDDDNDGSESGISGLSASDMGFINVPTMTSTDGVGISFDQLSAVSVSQLTTMQNGVLDLIGFAGGFSVDMSNTTDMTGSVIVLSGEAEVDLSNLTQFDGGGIEVYDGSTLSLPSLTSWLLESNIFGDTALWRAEGAGSTIIMPGLLTGQVGLNGTGGAKRWDIEAVDTAGGGIDFLAITDLLVEDSDNFSLRTINILADGGPAIVDLQTMDNFIDNDSDSPSTVTTAGGGGVVNISPLATLANVTVNGNFAIGDTGPGGGLVFFVDGSGGGLEAAPADLEDPNNQGVGDFLMPWGCDSTDTGATDVAIGTGAANTQLVVDNACSSAGNEAAEAADSYSNNGFTDWFLPSKDELNEMYLNIGQGGDGFNEGGFANDLYWSSSEVNSDDVWRQNFFNGLQSVNVKFSNWRVRAVRAF